MEAFQIEDVKSFMSDLLIGEVFDEFSLVEASITTFSTFIIDGHLNKDFLQDYEKEELKDQAFSKWKDLKQICYQIIRGRKIPNKFKFVFSKQKTFEDDMTLFLNVKFENNDLLCITGASMQSFPPNKELELDWDKTIKDLLKKYIS